MIDDVGWEALTGRAIEMLFIYVVGLSIMLLADRNHKQA